MRKLLAVLTAVLLLTMIVLPGAEAEGNMNKGTLLVQYCTANYELNKVLIDPAGGMGYIIRTATITVRSKALPIRMPRS